MLAVSAVLSFREKPGKLCLLRASFSYISFSTTRVSVPSPRLCRRGRKASRTVKYVNPRAWLCANEALFIKPGSRWTRPYPVLIQWSPPPRSLSHLSPQSVSVPPDLGVPQSLCAETPGLDLKAGLLSVCFYHSPVRFQRYVPPTV